MDPSLGPPAPVRTETAPVPAIQPEPYDPLADLPVVADPALGPGPDEDDVAPPPTGWRGLLSRYGRMLWWLHSAYALALGAGVIFFARKGFAHARWLTVSMGLAWILLLVFFRLYGKRAPATAEDGRPGVRYYVMTYVLKNLYQGMLFFLLPFYWESAVLGAASQWFVVALGVCAFLSTLDVVFDHVLMRVKIAASLFYFFTLFCCLNLVIPALMPNIRSLLTLVLAAVISALAFWTMHIPVRFLGRPGVVVLLITWTLGSLAGAYYGRAYVPPVALHVSAGAVGPTILPDGRLGVEARAIHKSLVAEELHAVTSVVIPGGKGDRLVHVWRKDGEVIQRSTDVDAQPDGVVGTVRLRSQLEPSNVPESKVGEWLVDVETSDGQLVGRVAFDVTE